MNAPALVHRRSAPAGEATTRGKVARCGIAFMAKTSASGRAKTRLVPPLSFDEAAALNTAFLRDVADNVLLAAHRAAPCGGMAVYAAFGPPSEEESFRRILPAGVGLIAAWQPDFGACLFHTVETLLARGHSAAVVLNSDSPTLPSAFLIEAAALLARPGDRAVIGPASDGGYYLLGLKAAYRRMFEAIAWSTARVAAQTTDRAREIGLELHTLPPWYDIDDVDGLRRLDRELAGVSARRNGAPAPHRPVRTARLMSRLRQNHDFGSRMDRALPLGARRA